MVSFKRSQLKLFNDKFYTLILYAQKEEEKKKQNLIYFYYNLVNVVV